MIRSLPTMVLAALVAGGVGAATAQVPARPMTPEAALAAVTAAPNGEVAGVFEMKVVSTGASGFQVYLNSVADYRSPANLTVELDPGPRAVLNRKLGGEAQDLMAGHRIRVTGVAKRVAIPIRGGGNAYQTRILVDRNDQLVLIE